MHVEIEERKVELSTVAHRLLVRDLSLGWHDTPLVSDAVQEVKAEILSLFDALGRRPEWADTTGQGDCAINGYRWYA